MLLSGAGTCANYESCLDLEDTPETVLGLMATCHPCVIKADGKVEDALLGRRHR